MGRQVEPKVSEAAALYARSSITDALFTATQRRVLSRLFGEPGRSWTVSELIRDSGAGSGAVQREVARLAGSGLLSVERVGNQKRYRANPDAPIHDELVAIVRKTFVLADPLREALAPIRAHVHAAFVYGSVAKGRDAARSDIDLLLVSDDLNYADAMTALQPLESQIGRAVNPTIYTRADLHKRMEDAHSFVSRILAQPRLWIIGGEDDLSA